MPMKLTFGTRLTTMIAPVALAAALSAPVGAAEKTQTLTGTVQTYSAAEHRFTVRDATGREIAFVWTHDTKFNGVVSEGAKVTVRYTPQADAPNVAQTVGVMK